MSASDIINEIDKKLQDNSGLYYIGIQESLGGISEIFRTLAGLLVTLIVIGIIFVLAIEVTYINFPILQIQFRKLSEKSKRMEKIMGICLRDANRAVEIANTKNTGKSVNMIYMGIKSKIILITFVILCLAINVKYVLILIEKLSIPVIELINKF